MVVVGVGSVLLVIMCIGYVFGGVVFYDVVVLVVVVALQRPVGSHLRLIMRCPYHCCGVMFTKWYQLHACFAAPQPALCRACTSWPATNHIITPLEGQELGMLWTTHDPSSKKGKDTNI